MLRHISCYINSVVFAMFPLRAANDNDRRCDIEIIAGDANGEDETCL